MCVPCVCVYTGAYRVEYCAQQGPVIISTAATVDGVICPSPQRVVTITPFPSSRVFYIYVSATVSMHAARATLFCIFPSYILFMYLFVVLICHRFAL